MDNLQHEKKKRFRWLKRAAAILVLLLIAPLLVLGIWNWQNFSHASQELFGSSSITALALPSELQNTSGRVNILIAGNTLDEPGQRGGDLTDSLQIVSLDQTTKTGYMLGIPRDLYVFIPGRGQAKINEAYQVGEQTSFSEPGYPDGGMGVLEKVIHDVFGLDIHYHLLIDSTTTREVVDALGGIEVTIASEDPRGLYDPNFGPRYNGPLELSNGRHQIDGMTALKLTRARGATYGSYGFPRSDLTRAQHQQLVFAAIKSELTPQLLLDPRKNSAIMNAIAQNTTTDIQLSEVLPLYRLLASVPSQELQNVSLHDVDGTNLLTGYTTPIGQSALIPTEGINEYGAIQSAVNKLNR